MQTFTTTPAAPAPKQRAAAKPATPQERKYFEKSIDPKYYSKPNLIWVNEAQQTANTSPNPKLPFHGLKLTEAPVIRFDRRTRKRGKLADAYIAWIAAWFVSDLLKQLLEQIDPQGFAFVATQIDPSSADEPGLPYWFCEMVRVLDAVDDEKSKVIYQTMDGDKKMDVKWYEALIDVKMRADVVGGAHAFRLEHATQTEIVDDIMVQAMQAAKMRAWFYRPLQQD